MIRKLNGIFFFVHSPCHYTLAASNEVVRAVDLSYDGQYWSLQVQLTAGHTVTRDFVSRDAALELMRGRAA